MIYERHPKTQRLLRAKHVLSNEDRDKVKIEVNFTSLPSRKVEINKNWEKINNF